jgi:hypothetical protein
LPIATGLNQSIAFSSEADTGSREENASKQQSGASPLIQSEAKMLKVQIATPTFRPGTANVAIEVRHDGPAAAINDTITIGVRLTIRRERLTCPRTGAALSFLRRSKQF